MVDLIIANSTEVICVGIILLFLFFLYKIYLAYSNVNSKLSDLLKKNLEIKENSILYSIWSDYYDSFIVTEQGDKTYEKASYFFNLPSVLQVLHSKNKLSGMNPSLLFSASNILVGIGIFGTFLGLTFGIKSVELGSSSQIQQGIEGLLGGMGTAFWTSLFGMGSSLILTFVERQLLGKLTMNLNGLCKKLDRKYLLTQRERNELQIIAFSEVLSKQLSYSEPGSQTQSIGRLLWNISKQTENTAAATESFVTDLSCDLETRFVTIKEAFGNLADEISKLGDKIQSPASNLMDSVVDEIKKMSGELIKEMKSSISESTNEDLTTIATLLMKSSQGLNELPSRLEKMTDNLNETFEGLRSSILSISKETVSQSADSIADLKNMIDSMAKTLEANDLAMQSSQQVILDRHNQTAQKTENILTQFQETIGSLESVNTGVTSSIDNIARVQTQTEDIFKSFAEFKSVMEQLSTLIVSSQKEQQNLSSKFITDSNLVVTEIKETLKVSSSTSVENAERYQIINNGLQEIFAQIEHGLQQYQKTMRDGIHDYLGQFTTALKDTMDSMSQQTTLHIELVEDLSKTVDKMKN
ncbi:MAG: hypothetical protein ACRDCN_12220 [Tannerellaceae bacterium]